MRIRQASACAAAIAAALAFTTGRTQGASKNFVPDVTFKGSSLSGWRPLGEAKWRAENGEIIATPNGSSGWLILDKSYQDVAFFSEFRCAPGCAAGLLLRAEKTADGGWKGIFVSLNPADPASYHVALDPQGKETSRERLRPAGGGQVRVAPPPRRRQAALLQRTSYPTWSSPARRSQAGVRWARRSGARRTARSWVRPVRRTAADG